MPLEYICQVLVLVIPKALLLRVVAIIVSPRELSTFWDGLGVSLIIEQFLELLLVIVSSAKTDLLVVDAAAGSADGDGHVVSSQTRDDLQHGLHAAAQIGCNLGADAVRPAPMLSRK